MNCNKIRLRSRIVDHTTQQKVT